MKVQWVQSFPSRHPVNLWIFSTVPPPSSHYLAWTWSGTENLDTSKDGHFLFETLPVVGISVCLFFTEPNNFHPQVLIPTLWTKQVQFRSFPFDSQLFEQFTPLGLLFLQITILFPVSSTLLYMTRLCRIVLRHLKCFLHSLIWVLLRLDTQIWA